MDPAELEAAGLYDPDAPGAEGRLALVAWLEEQGFGIDDLVEARPLSLSGLAADRFVRPGDRCSVREAAEHLGLTVEELEPIVLASGFPAVHPDARVLTEADVRAFDLFQTGARMFGWEPTIHFARVLAASMSRIAEAAIALFMTNVERPLAESESGELALAQANLDAVQTLGVIPPVMDALFRSQMEVAIRRSRLARRASVEPRLAVGFVDLVGFTPLSQQLLDHELSEVLDHFEGQASDIVTRFDGRVVKHIGDEVMYVAVNAADACRIGIELLETFRGMARDVRPRGGIAYGAVLTRAGDYYGPTVNLASRVGDLAVPFEVLVTEEVTVEAALQEGTDLDFAPAGRRMLKGFDEPVPLWSLGRRA